MIEESYDYGWVGAYFGGNISNLMLSWTDDNLLPDQIIEYESAPHVTLLYGITPEVTCDQIKEVIKKEYRKSVIEVYFRVIDIFKHEDQDVIIIKLEGDDLFELNKILRANIPHEETYPVYKPHATLAYVNPGVGNKFVGDKVFVGQKSTVMNVTFSSANEECHNISLGNITEMSTYIANPNAPVRFKYGAQQQQAHSNGIPKQNIYRKLVNEISNYTNHVSSISAYDADKLNKLRKNAATAIRPMIKHIKQKNHFYQLVGTLLFEKIGINVLYLLDRVLAGESRLHWYLNDALGQQLSSTLCKYTNMKLEDIVISILVYTYWYNREEISRKILIPKNKPPVKLKNPNKMASYGMTY